MLRLLTATVCCILLVAFASMAFAQSPFTAATQPVIKTDAEQNFRWMEYFRADTIRPRYNTIIHDQDLTPIATNSNYFSPTVRIENEFKVPFTIIGTRITPSQESAVHIEASVAGFFKFTRNEEPINPPTMTSYFLEWTTGDLSRLIMPYWGALESIGVPEGGIYHKYVEENSLIEGPDRLIIEWKVRAMGSTSPSILNFQAHIILRQPESPNSRYYATIEFHYGDNPLSFSWLNVPPGSPYDPKIGAAVGIKHLGQDDQYNTPAFYHGDPGSGLDDENTLMLPPNPVFSNNDNNIGVTRVPVYLGTSPMPELYSFTPFIYQGITAPPSRFFHLSFPRHGYRVKPVDNDLLTTGPGIKLPLDSNTVDSNRNFNVKAVFINKGGITLHNIPATAVVYRGGREMERAQGIISTLPPDADTLLIFSKKFGGSAYKPGAYQLVVFHGHTDQVPSNDTACTNFNVRHNRDFGPLELLAPDLQHQPNISEFNYPAPISVKARFANLGYESVRFIPVGYRILNHEGKPVHTARITLRRSFRPGASVEVTFPQWQPRTPGRYYIEVFSTLFRDGIVSNDTLPGTRTITYTWWGNTEQDRQAQHIPFHVRPVKDIEVLSAPSHPHAPVTGSTITGSFTPRLFFRNCGVSTAQNIPVQVLVKVGNRSLSSHTLIIPEIKAGHVIEFPLGTTIIASSGTYCVSVEAKMPGDQVSSNNKTQWCFKGQR